MNLTLKIVLVGESGAGKTSINHKFMTGSFEDNSHQSTIGALFSAKQYKITKYRNPIKVQFWDTAGQERYRSIMPLYCRGSSAILLIFDLTNYQSFQSVIDYWTPQLANETCFKIFLIGNKKDLSEQRMVSQQEAQEFAIQHQFEYREISAKDDDLHTVLIDIITSICDQIDMSNDKLPFYGIKLEVDESLVKKNKESYFAWLSNC